MKKLIVIVSLFISCFGMAHSPNIAYFDIECDSDKTVVIAEISWAIRNALLKNNPELEQSHIQSDFDMALFEYFETHLVFTNKNHETLPLKRVEKIPNQNHHESFQLIYEGSTALKEIKNTVLFDLFEHQRNENKIKYGGSQNNFSTSIGNEYYDVPTPSKLYVVIAFCILSIGAIFWWMLK